jgi:putative lumazine-binding protein
MTATTTTATAATATTPDYDEIVRVVQLYIDGWKGDVNKFKEAFHEDAWIFFTDADGVLHKSLLADCFEGWATANSHIEGRIISVTQAGDVANVLLGFDNPSDPSRS